MYAVERQQEFWASRFRDAGWQTGCFIDGMWTSASSTPRRSPGAHRHLVQGPRGARRRRRALRLPYSGMGVFGGMVGAYVLAGEINRHPDDLPTALANYGTVPRPFVDEIQAEMNPRLLRLGMPITQHDHRLPDGHRAG